MFNHWLNVRVNLIFPLEIYSVLFHVFCLAHKRQYGPWNCSIPDMNQIERNISNVSIGK